MLIDNEKFIALLADNSGIEKEKVEKYLEELISEMKASFDEGEGYEVEGFGIFSKLGSNILFIPSDELETEINYKYVGMEPIELPGGAQQQEPEAPEDEDENPIQGILDGGKIEEREEYEDPFAELFNEAEEHEKAEKEQAEKGDLSEEEIEAVVEEEIESEDTEEIIAEEPEKEEEPEEALEDTLKDIFGSDETEEETETEEPEPEEESAPGPENWGIDAHKEEEQEGAFSGLLGDAEEEPELIDEDDIFASEEEINSEEDVFEAEEELQQEENESEEETDEELDFSALGDDESEQDFDDPFDELIEEDDDEDFVPVVTNVSSGKASKKEAGEEKTEEDDGKTEKKSRTLKSPRDRKQSSPVFLYMILALILLGGTGYLLAYFGVVNIEGITPSSASTQIAQNSPPVTQPESTPPQTSEEEEQPVKEVPEVETSSESAVIETEENNGSSSNPESEITEEETPRNQENDIAPLVADEKAPGDGGIISPVNIQAEAEVYGLNGTATEAGNNGYTIVLYTLSRKSGADAQFEKLSKEGFRVIIKEKPSQEFGALYRVSIGQFESLADAAVAAEKVDSEILGNYIITKI
ncbi:MAG: SPOR domain-containing protein [Balneola sp.]|nr:SPOR domain-containing protein [Balneola sp.]